MENNNDLLERIRRSQQSGPLNERYDDNGNNSVVSENIPSQKEAEKAPARFFQKSSFPLPPFWALVFSLITFVLIAEIIYGVLDIELYFFEINEYIFGAIMILGITYWKACLNKWVEKKGETMLSKIVRFLLNLQILYLIISMVIDAYKWYKLG